MDRTTSVPERAAFVEKVKELAATRGLEPQYCLSEDLMDHDDTIILWNRQDKESEFSIQVCMDSTFFGWIHNDDDFRWHGPERQCPLEALQDIIDYQGGSLQ